MGTVTMTSLYSDNTWEGNQTFDSTVTFNGALMPNVGIGITGALADGTLHVHKATAGTWAPISSGNLLVLEDDTSNGISMAVPDGSYAAMGFSSPTKTGAYAANMNWQYNEGILRLRPFKVGASTQLGADDGVNILTLSGASGSELTSAVKDLIAGGGFGVHGEAAQAQASHITDASDLSTAITAINALLVVVENIGHVAKS